MTDIALVLGGVQFQDFEVPESIGIEGKQRLAIHRLMSGAQVIDVLGRDAQTVQWKGTLSGTEAAARACELDRLRLAGAALVLSWDIYSFAVLIGGFSADYRNPGWIPYALSCTVVQDLAAPVGDPVIAAIDLIAADIATAGQYVSVGGFQATIAAGGIVPGSAAYGAAMADGLSTQNGLNLALASAGTGISGSFPTALAACGSMASISAGMGYLGRAVTNLTNLEP